MKIIDPELGEINFEEGFTKPQSDQIEQTRQAETPQLFSDVLELHKAINKNIGINGVSEFNIALEAGDKPKARSIANALPSSHPLKKDMLKLLELV